MRSFIVQSSAYNQLPNTSIPNITKRKNTGHRQSTILALFPPNPQGERKERSHEALEKYRKKAESRETITIRHENEDVYTSDSDTA